jgi:hypothetical protein
MTSPSPQCDFTTEPGIAGIRTVGIDKGNRPPALGQPDASYTGLKEADQLHQYLLDYRAVLTPEPSSTTSFGFHTDLEESSALRDLLTIPAVDLLIQCRHYD